MAILEIVKNEVSSSDNVNRTETKTNNIDKEISLNSLNQKTRLNYDFKNQNNPEMAYGKLKTERSIVSAICSTMLMVFVMAMILFGGVIALFKMFDLKFVLFEERNYYSLEMFNSELGKFLLTLLFLLFIVSLIFVLFINLSVKVRFRKAYLSKTNVYVYDTFLCVFNILIFTMIGFVFFVILDSYYTDFGLWLRKEIVDPEVNLSIIGVFKYVIVIISALFMSFNSIKGISITHKMNDFIFRNHL